MDKKRAYIFIITAACLWGIIGVFITRLYALGFDTAQVVAVRAVSTTFFLVVYTFFRDRRLLKIRPADSGYFIGTGVFSVALFNWCLFRAIAETSISVATILLYTAPAFVTVLSRLFFRELLTLRKATALVATLAGCALVAGVLPGDTPSVSSYGLLLGTGAGFFYALYSVFAKFALRTYDALTVTVHTFLFAALASVPVAGLPSVLPLFAKPQTWVYTAGLSFFSTTLAYLLYTKGLKQIESSRASIIATVEPVVAALVSFFLFGEKLNGWQYVGMGLVIASVVLVQEPSPEIRRKQTVPNGGSP